MNNSDKEYNLETDDVKNSLSENIIPISNIKDFGMVNREFQVIYSYLNKVYCDLNTKIEQEKYRLDEVTVN